MRLTPREQRLAYAGAVVAAGAFTVLWAPSGGNRAVLVALAIGYSLALLLALTARNGSPVLTAFAAFGVSFGPWGYAWVFASPYLAFSGWLLYRSARAAQQAGPREPRRRRRAAAETDETPAPAAPPRPRPAPSASKRYTPPKRRSSARRGGG